MPRNPAFPFVPIDERRSSKPRTSGLSMVADYQIGLRALEDLLEVAAEYIDIFKICTGTSRLFEKDHLIQKNRLLRDYQVRPFLGGQFQEYVLHTMGLDAFPRHMREARDVGFDIIEISDNIVPLQGNRKILMDVVREHGMSPVGEIGDKRENSSPEVIVAEVKHTLRQGAEFAIVEGQELMLGSEPNAGLIELLHQEVDVSQCMFELSTPRVGSTLAEIYVGLKFLVKTFGPNVNLGNVQPDSIILTETTRLGLGAAGPLSLMKV